MLDGGFAGDTFRSMLDGAMSDKMAAAGGIGLAKVIAQSMSKDPETSAGTHALPNPYPANTNGPTQNHSNTLSMTSTAQAHMVAPLTASTKYQQAAGGIDTSQLQPDAEFMKPAPGRYTSGFGTRIDPINGSSSVHPGLDIAGKTGAPVEAAGDGIVTHAGPAGTYGNLVMIKHPDGLETRYAHMSAINVKTGDHVKTGDNIGAIGATGRVTGPHLHFEVRKDGKALDPRPYLQANSKISKNDM